MRRPKGTGAILKARHGWAVRYGPRGAQKYESGFRSKLEAEQYLALKRSEILQRRAGHAADPRHTPKLGELAEPWLERRRLTHKAALEDRSRWRKHLAPHFGHLRPDEVDHARVRAFAEAKLAEGLASGTVRVCIATLSSLYVDLVERGLAQMNPGRNLPRSLARIVKPSHDPTRTPFVERLEDVRRIFLALPPPLHVGYALGAFAGLRPGEAFALRWPQVDLEARRIHVVESVTGTLKDKDSRIVPILDPLLPVLKEWKVKSGGEGLLCKPYRTDGRHIGKAKRGAELRAVLERLGLTREGLGWYEATRHTFASHWVLGGGSSEKLSKVLGHYSVVMTERYAHLRPNLFADSVYAALRVDLTPGDAPVLALPTQRRRR